MRRVNTNKPKVTTPSCGWQELLTGRHVCSQPSVYRVSYDHCDHCSDGACFASSTPLPPALAMPGSSELSR